MQKRDPVKKEYFPYSVPTEWNCPLVTDLEEIINCTNCGKNIYFGEYFTSKQIHTEHGFGYPVCCQCYEKESK